MFIKSYIKNWLIKRKLLWKLWRKYKGFVKSQGDPKPYIGNKEEAIEGLNFFKDKCKDYSVLDIGCCDGLVSKELSRLGCNLIHGFDIDKPALKKASRLFDKDITKVVFTQCDFAYHGSNFVNNYKHLLKKYDITVFLRTYHHLKYQMS